MQIFRKLLATSNILWRYRDLIRSTVIREFQTKYRGSILGGMWSILSPLSVILVYTMVFSELMRPKLMGVDKNFAYSIFLCSGSLVWNMYAEIVTRMQNVFIENANLIKKINFPKICLPVIVVANSLVNFLLIFGIFILFLILVSSFPGLVILNLIPLLLIVIAFGAGLGVSLGVINVFFRDTGHFFSILLNLWYWFTPIVYPIAIIPEQFKAFISFNPLTPLFIAIQNLILDAQSPNWITLIPIIFFSIVLMIVGYYLFIKNSDEIVDQL